MKTLPGLALLLLLFTTSTLFAQACAVVFVPHLHGAPLALGKSGADAGAGEVVEAMQFYLSDLALLNDGQVVSTSTKRHHLLDAEKPKTLRLPLSVPDGVAYDELRFTLGVDSLTSAAGVFAGDLDPTNGLYWTWRSGYINFKLEGTAPGCPARNHRFQFHLGGFQAPYNSTQKISLSVHPAAVIPVSIDLDRFFAALDLSAEYRVMQPGAAAQRLAEVLAGAFGGIF